MSKRHYWNFYVKHSKGYSSVTVDCSYKFITEKIMDDVVSGVKSENNCDNAIIASISYLGKMTENEFNGE